MTNVVQQSERMRQYLQWRCTLDDPFVELDLSHAAITDAELQSLDVPLRTALTAMQKQKFALCFLDLQLPDITGDEIYRQAKDIDPKMPIVIITGYPDSQMLDNILRYGPVTVLKKPLQVELLEQVLKMLGHELREKAA